MTTSKLSFKSRLHEIIFESDTRAGKAFDVTLLVLIILSVAVVMLESIPAYEKRFRNIFYALEWFFTIVFTIEYLLRLYSTLRPFNYARSFFGIVDLLSILPTYISLFLAGAQTLMMIRVLRLLRVFRIFKLSHSLNQGAIIVSALRASRTKISVFLYAVVLIVSIFGALMYLVEGSVNKEFDSIPRSIYWSIVTLTTVGYGDITPITGLGQLLANLLMITGYAVIAVPTGIVTSEMVKGIQAKTITTQVCRYCAKEGHDVDAKYCKNCGERLND